MYTVYVVNRMKTRMETCVKTQNTTPNTTQNGKRADMYEKKVLLYSSCIIVLEQKKLGTRVNKSFLFAKECSTKVICAPVKKRDLFAK